MMLTLTSNEQAKELIHKGILAVDDDIEIAFDGFSIDADIKCHNIYSKDKLRDIDVWNIKAGNINALDIKAGDIYAGNIDARDIYAGNIDARDIYAGNINANDINAEDIYAGNINYYAVCFAYHNIKCKSIKGRHPKARHFCLNGEVIIKGDQL